ncbi:NmrA family NAD(P)-binding protein, partial [Xanthomonas sacchari]|uniref:NAD-dependent epimerase/dehydratase family protein n=1 Tax=Xanthomonas sacchari TaxID=56458 RepID=UPI00225E087B
MSGMLAPEVLVLGGSGTVGQGVVQALLEAGSPVLAVARDRARLTALHDGTAVVIKVRRPGIREV